MIITIFIMKNKIEDKLLLFRAKKFAVNLKGLNSFSIYPLDNDIFYGIEKS